MTQIEIDNFGSTYCALTEFYICWLTSGKTINQFNTVSSR